MYFTKAISAAIVVGLVSLFSCTQETTIHEPVPDNPFSMFSHPRADGYVMINGSYAAGDSFSNYSARAVFSTNNGDSVLFSGAVMVDGLLLVDSTGELVPLNGNLQPAGRTIPIVVAGSSEVGAFSDSLLVPEDIYLHRTEEVSKSGHTITWQSSSLTPDVVVMLTYNGALSQREDSSLPGTDIYVHKVVPDNGSYTFTAQELSGFAVGGLAKVNLFRGTSKKLTIGNKTYYLYSYLSSSQIDVPIVP